MSLKEVDFNFLIESVLKHEKNDIISYFYTNAVLNNYEKIAIYENNLRTLRSVLNNLTQNQELIN